jgi:signal peptidase I
MHDRPLSGRRLFRCRGGSMHPVFRTGDLVEVVPTPSGKLRPGDCVVYRKAHLQPYIIHRVVSVRPSIRTRGDARPFVDVDPVSPEWIIGRVVSRVRFGRETRVRGGKAGMTAGKLYGYAGRLDPSRRTKGGKLARLVRSVSSRVFRLFPPRHIAFVTTGGKTVHYLLLLNRIIGAYNNRKGDWDLAWPFDVLGAADGIAPPHGESENPAPQGRRRKLSGSNAAASGRRT